MGRRRLYLNCSDDETDILWPDTRATPQLHQQTIAQTNTSPPHPSSAIDISDEETADFIDVSEDLSKPSPPSPPPLADSSIPGPTRPTPAAPLSCGLVAAFEYPVSEYLGRMGVMLRREWLSACLNRLGSVHGFTALDVGTKAKLCFEQFLLSDMNYSGGGVLPANVDSLHLIDLSGPLVLQVDEIVNISCPLRGRYQNAPVGLKRCLKLSMTDGVQRVFGMEYRPIKDLEAMSPAGFKVALCNIHIRHGLLTLVPEAVEVLGGMVNELEAAREQLVCEVNKPARGRRTHSGLHPPLATRATRAAWTSGSVINVASCDHSMEAVTNSHAVETVAALAPSVMPTIMRTSVESTSALGAQNEVSGPSTNFISDFEEMHVDAVSRPLTNIDIDGMPVDSAPADSENAAVSPLPRHVSAIGEMDPEPETTNGETVLPDSVLLDQDVNKIIDDVEHPQILCGDWQSPFTYLACLSAKWAAMREKSSSVMGKVKCLLTGVKGFLYKQRMTYELRVYVDDGSLISEILIDHNVVQNGIGHAPEEVTGALSSADKKVVSSMRETLKQFQLFLSNFEGIMLIELNEASPVPIARQLTEGCASSDARLLLERLRSQPRALQPSCPIELSP